MSKDQDIYIEIGQTLFENAPDNALKILFRSQVSPEGDHAIMQYNTIDFAGKITQFRPVSGTGSFLLEKVMELRDFFVSQGQPSWKSMEMAIDVQSGNFDVSFDYD